MTVIYHGVKTIHGWENALIFEVETAVGPVYMSFGETIGMESRSFAVVNSEIFLALWRACPYTLHKDIANGSLETWRNDRKYHHAEEGFSDGITNPVPLAEINYSEVRPKQSLWTRLTRRKHDPGYISFTNGITRTIWLLSNGAKGFPVELPPGAAERLTRVAGYTNYQSIKGKRLNDHCLARNPF